MPVRTDLAIDNNEALNSAVDGVEETKENLGDVKISDIRITTERGEKAICKPKGEYITIEFPQIEKITDFTNLKNAVKKSLSALVPKNGSILVAGLGNTDITPDAVGPLTAHNILATRHIAGQFAKSIGLDGLKSVSVIAPGVLGKTGIEATELIAAAVKTVDPAAVIVIDALATRSISRMFTTIQLCNTGISPGSGVKNSRKEVSQKTLGVPVIAVGVPTVVDAASICYELTNKEPDMDNGMIVTPKEVDLLISRISEILSDSINVFLQPDIDEDIILGLV